MNIFHKQNSGVTTCPDSLLNEWGLSADVVAEMIRCASSYFSDSHPQIKLKHRPTADSLAALNKPIVQNVILSDESPCMDFSHEISTLEDSLAAIENHRAYHLSDNMMRFLMALLQIFRDGCLLSDELLCDFEIALEENGNGEFPTKLFKKIIKTLSLDNGFLENKIFFRDLLLGISENISSFKLQTTNPMELSFIDKLKDAISEIDLDDNLKQILINVKKAIVTVVDDVFPEVSDKSIEDIKEVIRHYHETVLLLGEYRSEDRSIILYYNNIDKDSQENVIDKCNLMKIVLFHELVHAVLHPTDYNDNCYFSYLEEPICEYGMLCLAERYEYSVLLNDAMNHVKMKQSCAPLFHYGYGSYIYKREELDNCHIPDGRYVDMLYKLKVKYLKSMSNLCVPCPGSTPKRQSLDIVAECFESAFLGQLFPYAKRASLYAELAKRVCK